MRNYSMAAALALSLVAAPAAFAQAVGGEAGTTTTAADGDDDFPLGLLGLLGLAGLFGLRRRDSHVGDRR